MERTYEVKVYKTELLCDGCGVGYLKPTGVLHGGWPAKFSHQCTHCNMIHNYLTEQYPKITYIDAEIK